MGEIKEFDDYIIFKEDTHQYFRKHDMQEFISVSKFLSKFSIPFNKDLVSRNMTDSKEEQQELLSEWEANTKRATDYGHLVHAETEHIIKFGNVKDPKFKTLERNLMKYLRRYKRNFSELIAYNDQYEVCGTADWPALRNTQGGSLILDVNDFKTNINNGIRSYTGKIDRLTNVIKYYNKYFLEPIEYMEASDYNKYAFQLSIYAYMFELMWDKVKIGGLNIMFINEKLEIEQMPVPYLRPQVQLMFERYKTLKKIDSKQPKKLYKDENNSYEESLLRMSDESTLSLLSANTDGDYPDPSEYE